MFSPDPAEVAFAKKIVAAMPDGTGAVMIDGKMQDDATWKQAKVLVDLARLVAAKDPDMGGALWALTDALWRTLPRPMRLIWIYRHEQDADRQVPDRPGGASTACSRSAA